MSSTNSFPRSSQPNFSEMDDARISAHHWKIMFLSGMGFFTDAYDLFIIGVVMTLLKPIWNVQTSPIESRRIHGFCRHSPIGALLFGRVADMVGRKKIHDC